jgi:hypothetical protein
MKRLLVHPLRDRSIELRKGDYWHMQLGKTDQSERWRHCSMNKISWVTTGSGIPDFAMFAMLAIL